jgi:hypothetical protein
VPSYRTLTTPWDTSQVLLHTHLHRSRPRRKYSVQLPTHFSVAVLKSPAVLLDWIHTQRLPLPSVWPLKHPANSEPFYCPLGPSATPFRVSVLFACIKNTQPHLVSDSPTNLDVQNANDPALSGTTCHLASFGKWPHCSYGQKHGGGTNSERRLIFFNFIQVYKSMY